MNTPARSTFGVFAESAGARRRVRGTGAGGAQLCQNPRLRSDLATASPR